MLKTRSRLIPVTSSCSGGGVGRRLAAKSTAYLASIESLDDSDEGKRPAAVLQRLKTSSQGIVSISL